MTANNEEGRDVVIVVPVLRRFHRIRPLLESITAATPEPHRVLFVGTTGDVEMLETVARLGSEFGSNRRPVVCDFVRPNPVGDYARKVNHAVRMTTEPFIFTAADDLDFRPGWLPAALAPFTDPAVGLVGTQDRCNPRTIRGEHSTHFMIRRAYIEQHGTIDAPGLAFHEGYPHEYVDDEAVETAKARGAWAFAGDSVVEHLHPMNGRAPMDALYAQHAARMRAGRKVYGARRTLWAHRRPRPTADNVAIIVATFGDQRWSDLAHARAIPSAMAQRPAQLIVEHGPTLADARNSAAAQARTEWLCFLDADDELEAGYLEAMTATTSGDLLAPAVRYVAAGEPEPEPVTLEARNIATANPCVIGTLVRRSSFEAVGGFWRERAWEDWSLFRRCWLLGDQVVHVPRAVYRAHTDPAGRNSTIDNPAGLHRQITQLHAKWNRQRKAAR